MATILENGKKVGFLTRYINCLERFERWFITEELLVKTPTTEETIPSDSNINSNPKQEFNKSRNDSLIAAEEDYFKKLKIALKDSSGKILGVFEGAEMVIMAHYS
jgi:hypothetical protein